MRTKLTLAIALGLTSLVAPILTPVPAGAQVDDLPALGVSGTVTDALGRPADACVFLRADTPPVLGFRFNLLRSTTITDPATGRYSFDVPPGYYELWAYSPLRGSTVFPECPDPVSVTRFNNETYVKQGPRKVMSPGPEVDFALDYEIMGGAYGYLCCTATAVIPGGSVDLLAWTSRRLRDDVTVIWRDVTSGAEVALPWDQPFWIDLYDTFGCSPRIYRPCEASPHTTFTMPTEDGFYPYELWGETADGTLVTRVVTGGVYVDSVAPVIEQTYPADGETAPLLRYGGIELELDASDVGAGPARARVEVRDLTDSGAGVFVRWMRRGATWGDWSEWFKDAAVGHHYQAKFTVWDQAGNSTVRTTTFGVKPYEEPPCGSVICTIDRAIEDVAEAIPEQAPGAPASPWQVVG